MPGVGLAITFWFSNEGGLTNPWSPIAAGLVIGAAVGVFGSGSWLKQR
jgi:hypothetical protein